MTSDSTDWAVVVGGSGALGSAIVRALVGRDLRVVAVARRSEGLEALTASDANIVAVRADIARDTSGALIAAAVDGPVRMIVMAAGLPASGPVGDVPPDALGEAVSLKAGGLLRLVRGVDHRLGPGSRIVALGGHYGFEPTPGATTAGVTNAALANLIRQLSDSLGPRGITAHLVAPGPVETARLEVIAAGIAQSRGVPTETVMEEFRAGSPLGRLTTPEQVAWGVALLLDPEADALTGAMLALDSGERHGIF